MGHPFGKVEGGRRTLGERGAVTTVEEPSLLRRGDTGLRADGVRDVNSEWGLGEHRHLEIQKRTARLDSPEPLDRAVEAAEAQDEGQPPQ
jgi:hypothetical protein